MRRRIRIACVVALAGVLIVPVAAFAQLEAPLWTVTTVEIKHDMVAEWEQLQRELNERLAQAGRTDRRVAQVVRGPSTEYRILEPVGSFAAYDDPSRALASVLGETAASQWVARVTKTVKNRSVETFRRRPDLSIPIAEGRTPTFVVLRIIDIKPDRTREYVEWLTNTWVPTLKAAGIDGVDRAQDALNANRWHQARYLNDWAELDANNSLIQRIGRDRYQEIVAEGAASQSQVSVKVLRRRPDLSLLP